MDNETCKICGETISCEIVVHLLNIQGKQLHITRCERCGRYYISELINDKFETKKFRSCLYYFFRHSKRKNEKPYYVCEYYEDNQDNNNKLLRETFNFVTVDEVLKLYPENIIDRTNKILQNLSDYEPKFGTAIDINTRKTLFSSIFFLETDEKFCFEEIGNIVRMFRDEKLLKIKDNKFYFFTLTFEAWKKIDLLNSSKAKTQKVFIAMWYNQETNAFREAIKCAITEKGYIPTLVDEKEHNNYIPKEIFYEIRMCDFLVADLTGERGNVYLEAGYALGLGKKVIFTLNDKDDNASQKVQFDIDQINRIQYKDSEDLKDKLIKRIEATVDESSNIDNDKYIF